MQGSLKHFSLGWFDYNYLSNCELATVESQSGEIIAFTNIVPEYQLNEVTIDLMSWWR